MVETQKKFPLLLTVGAATFLIAGGGLAYWILSQPKASPEDLPIGADVVPQDALMTLSVTTDRGQWDSLRQFGTPQSQSAFDQGFAQVRDRFLTANGFDYERDIQPWVGREVTVAFLASSLPTVPETPNAPIPPPPSAQSAAIVLPIQDGLKAKEILEKPRSQSGQLSQRNYKGFQIQESSGTGSRRYSAAALDGKYLVVTTDPKSMDKVIDTYQGGASLAATPGYTRALGRIKVSQPFGKVYVNLPAAAALTAASSGRPLSGESLAQVQQNQGLAATVTLESDGIHLKSVSWLKPDSQRKYQMQNAARVMPSRLPAETLIMASGGNLKQFWQDYTQGATANPVVPIPPDTLRQGIQSTIGMDWEQDFMSWMEGEFSLGLVMSPTGNTPTLPFSILLMVQASDRRAGETALKKLDEAMTNKYKVKVEETQVGGQTVTNWAVGVGGPTVSHGWMDGNIAFLSLGAPIANALLPKPAKVLADSEAFKQAVKSDLNPNNGNFYINIEQANAKNLPLLQLPAGNKEIVAAIRTIGVTAAVSDDRTSRYDVFVGLQKAGKLNPLPQPTVPPVEPSPTTSPSLLPSP